MIRKSALLAALAAFTLATSQASADTFVRIVSGPAGGSWYPLGAKMAEILEKEVDGISTSNGPGGGVGNVKDANKKPINGDAKALVVIVRPQGDRKD